ncbi:hypothetical protein R3P38DRAFT_3511932, partial [Favolaschia claudopus]
VRALDVVDADPGSLTPLSLFKFPHLRRFRYDSEMDPHPPLLPVLQHLVAVPSLEDVSFIVHTADAQEVLELLRCCAVGVRSLTLFSPHVTKRCDAVRSSPKPQLHLLDFLATKLTAPLLQALLAFLDLGRCGAPAPPALQHMPPTFVYRYVLNTANACVLPSLTHVEIELDNRALEALNCLRGRQSVQKLTIHVRYSLMEDLEDDEILNEELTLLSELDNKLLDIFPEVKQLAFVGAGNISLRARVEELIIGRLPRIAKLVIFDCGEEWFCARGT